MFDRIFDLVREEVSGSRALDYAAELVRFDRSPYTPSFSEAARRCVDLLAEAGLEAELLTFPADGRTRHWTITAMPLYEVEEAELSLVTPRGRRRLCRFSDDRFCLIQRSGPTPPEGREADLVVVDRADRPESYEGRDVRGKFVLATGDLEHVRRLAVDERGAAGIIRDDMPVFPGGRPPLDLTDAVSLARFRWNHDGPPAVGFSLSQRQGRDLRSRAAKGPVRLLARVSCRSWEGESHGATAVLPGETPEEILLVAHLCHPGPSANDNASGSAAALEVGRVLGRLRQEGGLPRLRRGIRLLLVAEMRGTQAYLQPLGGDIGRFTAGLNLDMVGTAQEKGRGTLLAESPPAAQPSCVGDLLHLILERAALGASNFAGTAAHPAVRFSASPFSGGSDHMVLSDPLVDIPCPMLIQWPDRFYHTSADTIDKLDPDILARVAAAAATYTLFLAGAGLKEACWLGHRLVSRGAESLDQRLRGHLDRLLGAAGDEEADTEATGSRLLRLARFWQERRQAAVDSLERLVPAPDRDGWRQFAGLLRDQVAATATATEDRVRRLTDAAGVDLPAEPSDPEPAPWRREAAELVPRRLMPGVTGLAEVIPQMSPEGRRRLLEIHAEHGHRGLGFLDPLLYWIDGRRTLAEAIDLVDLERDGCDGALALEVARLAADAGLLELGPA